MADGGRAEEPGALALPPSTRLKEQQDWVPLTIPSCHVISINSVVPTLCSLSQTLSDI